MEEECQTTTKCIAACSVTAVPLVTGTNTQEDHTSTSNDSPLICPHGVTLDSKRENSGKERGFAVLSDFSDCPKCKTTDTVAMKYWDVRVKSPVIVQAMADLDLKCTHGYIHHLHSRPRPECDEEEYEKERLAAADARAKVVAEREAFLASWEEHAKTLSPKRQAVLAKVLYKMTPDEVKEWENRHWRDRISATPVHPLVLIGWQPLPWKPSTSHELAVWNGNPIACKHMNPWELWDMLEEVKELAVFAAERTETEASKAWTHVTIMRKELVRLDERMTKELDRLSQDSNRDSREDRE